MPRLLLRLAFDGPRFWGSQRQPAGPTVDGAILEALEGAGLLAKEPDLRPQGRTDRGVSARDYPVALDVHGELETVARTIAGIARGIVPWAGAVVEPGFDPRRAATARTYVYHWPFPGGQAELDAEAAAQAWQRFQGTHDVSAFAKVTDGKNPVRTILATEFHRPEGGPWTFRVSGRSFLWRQVRRMVGAALMVAEGKLSVKDVEQALETGELPRHRLMPADGLVLWRVDLPVETPVLPEARALGLERMAAHVQQLRQRLAALEAVLTPPTDR